MMENSISGVEHGVDQRDNSILLRRSTGTLGISSREAGQGEWRYDLDQRRAGGGNTLELTADNQGHDGMTENEMIDAVTDWLKE
jgi:hypothetical protein